VRLRPLTEAECYARCYGGRREETVSIRRFDDLAEQRPTEQNDRADEEVREAA
jgi:hypothetical protein